MLVSRDGPLAATRLYHENSHAAEDIRIIPVRLTRKCIRAPPAISASTKCPANARKMPRQKISSECWPHRIERTQPGRSQPAPILVQEPDRDRRQRQEMREAQHVEVGLVDRIHPLFDQPRHQRMKLRDVPRQCDKECREQIGNRDRQGDVRRQDARHPLRAAERAPGPEHEQQLPGEGIERPHPARIGREIEIEMPGRRIQRHRQREREIGGAAHQPQHRRQEEHQHDVERQHVHVDRTKPQQQRLDDGDVRLLQEIEDAHFLGVERVFERGRDVGDFRQEDHEQKDVGDVDLPDPLHDPRGRDHEAEIAHRPAVDEGRGVAGDEDEDLGGVAETVVADGQPGQQVGRQMIDEDQPQRQAAEQIEPQFALTGGGDRVRRRRRPRRHSRAVGRHCAGRFGDGRHGAPVGQVGNGHPGDTNEWFGGSTAGQRAQG